MVKELTSIKTKHWSSAFQTRLCGYFHGVVEI